MPTPREVSIAGRPMLAVLAPVIAGIVALLLHWLLPNEQTGLPTQPYPVVLRVLLGCGILMAVTQLLVPSFRPWARHYGPLLAGLIVWLCLWDLMTLKSSMLPVAFFPSPDTVFQAIVDKPDLFLGCTLHSLRLLATGYFSGVALGLFFGVLMGWFQMCRYWGMPILKLVGPIPATALIPLTMVLFSDPLHSGAALIAVAVCFPVTMLTVSGIANVPASYFDVARTLGAGQRYLIFRVAIPAALPSIFIGLFMGLGASFLTLMVAETVGVKDGLGYELQYRQSWGEYDKVFAILLIMAVFFSGIMTLLFKIRDRVLSWQKGVIRW